ncbi:hypothetical protein Jolie1_063 [Mycobacterium phage Julie1]|uniref:Uncharacterized protein n=1 Tax=Mycobacterium phage Julie1 TaxID=1463812 RepID=W8EK08_9CAUD|nr:hypothetical protein CG90_gp63 [Mycobacterium phage Julie1]AHJ88563.1 hypothetical protein Jolie1_063 [Mycobacterium phage Julie1]
MPDLNDMHDDEVRARLGLPALGRPMTMEERIEYNALRAFPEPFDPETEVALDLADVLYVAPGHRPDCPKREVPLDGHRCFYCWVADGADQ